MFKIIVAGSRDFNDYQLLERELIKFMKELGLNDNQDIEIVSGTARGADKLGEQFGRKHGYAIKQFPANWDTYGKSAGYRRNADMANYANACIVFWDGKSKGSKHMIDLANKCNLKVKVVRF